MRIINLVFHIGNGKTATTYLQNCLENTSKIYYVGKNKNDEFKDPVINKIHYKLFPSYRGEYKFYLTK